MPNALDQVVLVEPPIRGAEHGLLIFLRCPLNCIGYWTT